MSATSTWIVLTVSLRRSLPMALLATEMSRLRINPHRGLQDESIMPNYLAELPHFLAFLGMGLLLLGVFWSLYTLVTPYDEIVLIKAGNSSAAVILAGAVLGFAIPVGVAMAKSGTVMQLAQWGAVSLIVQFAAYLILRLLHRELHDAIQQDRLSVALWGATLSLGAGIINAGAQLA